jgi:hypothetical protein
MLALEDGKMKGGRKKLVRDVYHLWPVHQQDRAALVVELPPAVEDDALIIRDISVSSMILVARQNKRRLAAYAPTEEVTSETLTSKEFI